MIRNCVCSTFADPSCPVHQADGVRQYAAARGLRAVRCGLNADWCVDAWHLLPLSAPARPANVTPGDLYLLDGEEGTWLLVRRFYASEAPGAEDLNDRVEELLEDRSVDACLARGAELLK